MRSLYKFAYNEAIKLLLALVRLVVNGILYCFRPRARVCVPPVTDPLLLRSATSLAADIRHGKVSSEAVVKAYICRIGEVESYVNATTERLFAQALGQARAVDALVRAAEGDARQRLVLDKPLLGVPFSVKALIKVKGRSAEWGSRQYAGQVAAEDAEVVRLMRAAGAIPLAVTNVPEMGMAVESDNPLYGRSCNPYDVRRTPGGSSGGEGALVGAAGSVVGLGNDMGGSIRLPAAFCGIFGHKPSRGAVSNAGTFPVGGAAVDKFVYAGPMCRYAEDLITMMKILNEGTSVPLNFGKVVDFSKLKIYYKLSMDNKLTVPQLSEDYTELMKKALGHFETSYGTRTEEARQLDLRDSPAVCIHAMRSELDLVELVLPGRPDFDKHRELVRFAAGRSRMSYRPLLAMHVFSLPCFYREADVPRYRARAGRIERTLQELLDRDEEEGAVLLYPTFSQAAPFHHQTSLVAWSAGYTALFNLLGLPATQCPLGLDGQGLPLGVQVVAGRGRDPLALAVALELEKGLGGWVQPRRR